MGVRIGCCITPHGFGHAARTAAVMEAMAGNMAVEVTVVTTVPEWFFRQSLTMPFRYYALQTDIGLIQKSSLYEDLESTLTALDEFYPLSKVHIERAMDCFAGCDLLVCDIAPLGIVVAERLGIPSLLIENFTWDWIYSGYLERIPGLEIHIQYLKDIYNRATYHLQTVPVCRTIAAPKVPPISRAVRLEAVEVRRRLDVSAEDELVLITMGGMVGDDFPIELLTGMEGFVFLLPGRERTGRMGTNVRCMPQESGLYHPDLVAAADAVVGKVGYSTLAEVYAAGVPFGYILREGFPESPVLADFIRSEIAGLEIAAGDFQSGDWLHQLQPLVHLPSFPGPRENGADKAARYILNLLRPMTVVQ